MAQPHSEQWNRSTIPFALTNGEKARCRETSVQTGLGLAWCARLSSMLCAFAEQTPDRKELVLTAFDPVRGKKGELARFATDPNAEYKWSLSPHAKRIGILKSGVTYTCFG